MRGVEGMVEAIRAAREDGTPFFGICLGMQVAIIEFARDVCGLDDSNSSEFAPECSHPVIALMESQTNVKDMGGTMRLGAYACRLARGSRAAEVYGVPEISERHRHRYEVSNQFRDLFVLRGLPVPPGAQVTTDASAPAVRGLHCRGGEPPHPARRAARGVRRRRPCQEQLSHARFVSARPALPHGRPVRRRVRRHHAARG